MQRYFLTFALAFFPTWMVRGLVEMMGHRIEAQVKVGFSLLFCDQLSLSSGSQIGHFNFIKVDSLSLGEHAKVGRLNIFRGPVDVLLEEYSEIGNRNVVARAPLGVTTQRAELRLQKGSKITAGHSIDSACSVSFGEYSILAGKGSQIWTHGYVHAETGSGRYRIDGPVSLGDNVYLGSSVIISGGVSICNRAMVGAGVAVTRDLKEPGFYVSAPIRMLPRPCDPETRDDLVRTEDPSLLETVYIKKR